MNFIDTNILVYAAEPGDRNRSIAAQVIDAGGIVSVQVLNELANVLRSKKRLDWNEVVEALDLVIDLLDVAPVALDTHKLAIDLARRYGIHIYDANILAAALLAGCDTLYSEDMQNGLLVEGRLRVVNPFA